MSSPAYDVGPEAGTEEWLEERRRGITATDAVTIMRLNRWQSRLSLYLQKVGLAPPPTIEKRMRLGLKMEPEIAADFLNETGEELGHTIERAGRLIINKKLTWMRATPDYWVMSGDDRAILQCKMTSMRDAWRDETPDYVQCQVQHEMAVSGVDTAYVAVWLMRPNSMDYDFLWQRIGRDQQFIDRMIEEELAFLEMIRNETPPDAEGDPSALAMLHPRHDPGRVVDLGADFHEIDQELAEVKADLKELGARKVLLETRIKEAIGDAEAGVLPNGVVFTWRNQERAEHVVKASSFRILRRKEPRA